MILFVNSTRGNLKELKAEFWQEGVARLRRRAKFSLQPSKLPSSFDGKD